tara:strand:+ start:18110 stop:18943 length:834 start_codon:yes stop_codon:yes gene_type:complete
MIKQLLKKTTINNRKIEVTSTKKLSIQFSLDGFSFCISNRYEEIYKFSSYNFLKNKKSPELILDNLKEVFNQEKSLQEEFESVTVIHQNNLNSLVPNKYFKDENLKDYLKYSIKTIATDLIVFDDLDFMKCKNIYIPYVNINNFLFQNFGEFEYKHHSSILLEKLFLKSTYELQFFVNVSRNMFDIAVIKNKKLLFFNIFKYQTKEDFIYYILFTLEQLELSTEDTIILLLGDIEKSYDTYQILYKYIRNIDFLNSKQNILINQKEISKHSSYILLG